MVLYKTGELCLTKRECRRRNRVVRETSLPTLPIPELETINVLTKLRTEKKGIHVLKTHSLIRGYL